MPSEQIVDSRLFIRLDLSNSSLINQHFTEDAKNKAHLASQLLLYDKIVLPTIDFGIIPTLISWFGLNDFYNALDSGALQFLRRDKLLAYNGGLGIGLIKIEKGDSARFSWWQEALVGEDDISLEIQLTNRSETLSKDQRNRIVQKVIENTTHLNFEQDQFMKYVVNESYSDIINNPSLHATVKKYGKKARDGNIYLERLEEVPSNKSRVLQQDGQLTDVADLVLRVAEINMEIAMATQANNADLFTSEGADKILQQKLFHAKLPQRLTNGFMKLLDLKKIPDIRPAIINGKLSMSDIWEKRQSAKGRKFREWLRQADPKSAVGLQRAYIEAIEKNNLSDSLPTRLIRFAVTSILGIANPIIGLGSSVIDSFFIDKWINGYSPKLFFDELQKLTIKKDGSGKNG